MRKSVKAVSILAILVLAAGSLTGTAAAADNSGSIAVVFKDATRQTLDLEEIARILPTGGFGARYADGRIPSWT